LYIIELVQVFKAYDKDKNGTMDSSEFKQVLIDLGYRDVTEETVQETIKQVDRNNDSLINWNEFLEVYNFY